MQLWLAGTLHMTSLASRFLSVYCQARRNSRAFPSLDVLGEYVIYNYAPTTGASSYEHYVFPASTP